MHGKAGTPGRRRRFADTGCEPLGTCRSGIITSVFAPPLGVCVLPPNLNMGARRPAAAWAVADRSEIRHRGTKNVAGSCNVSHTTMLQNPNLRDTMHQTHPVLLFLSRSFLSLSPRLDGGW